MKSSVIKRSIVIDGHKTSVSLEDAFWDDPKKIAHARQVTLSELFVLQRFRSEDKQTEGA
jgi:predicted DNA-binding ribbon-helix-helix protein